jgi:hypothetical protein
LVASSRGTTLLGELAVFDANDVGGDPGGGSAIAGEGPVRGPERWKLRSSTAKLLRCMSPEMAHRDISLRREIRSLPAHSGHGRACCRLEIPRGTLSDPQDPIYQ